MTFRAILLLIACLPLGLRAQQATSDFWEDPLGEASEAPVEAMPLSEEALFIAPLALPYGGDPFTRLSDFNFAATRYSRRGYDFSWEQNFLGDLQLGDALSGRQDYNLLTALRYAPSLVWDAEHPESYAADIAPLAGSATLMSSDRAGRMGFRTALRGRLAEGWYYAASLGRRWGRDAQVDGIFLDQTTFTAAVKRVWRGTRLTLSVAGAPTERSSRTATTAEAYRLTGDNLYNPSWGRLDGEQRSSRIRGGSVPMAALLLEIRLGRRPVDVSAAWRGGESRFSGLSWYDAASPLPDYYRYLPSFIAEPTASGQVAGLWRAGDRSATQIDWRELSYQNLMAGGPAVYLTADDAERVQGLQFVAALRRGGDYPALDYRYGVRARVDRTDNFRRVRDLLGAQYLVDIDQFLVDDEFYGDQAQNDLRHPDRRVSAGRFGYNYRLRRDYAGVFGSLRYVDFERARRFEAEVEGGNASLWREGFYEKELFAGAKSFGKSRRATFFDYKIRLSAASPLAARHFLSAEATFENRAPLAADLFLQTRYNNAMVDDPRASGVVAGELNYRYQGRNLQLWVNGFFTQTRDQTQVLHYYDDLSGEYADLVLSGVAKRYYGVEVGAQIALSSHLTLQMAAATGSYTYAADPRADLFADGGRIYVGERVPLTGFRLGTSPQSVATAELRYSGGRGWLASLSAACMADHYIAPDPTRRMARATAYTPSPEAFAAMTAQECFDPAFTLGVFVWKRLSDDLALTLSIDNLLDNSNIIYSGYEPMRLRRSGDGIDRTYAPHASKYLYSRGRTWYASLTYRF